MAAPTFVAAGAFNNNWYYSSFDLAYPAGVQEGDVLLIHMELDGGPTTVTSGWTRVGSFVHTSGETESEVWYRVAGDSEPSSVTIQRGSINHHFAVMTAWRGVDTSSPIDVYGYEEGDGAGYTMSAPSVTATVAQSVVIHSIAVSDNDSYPSEAALDPTNSVAGDVTTVAGPFGTGAGNDGALWVGYVTSESAGASGSMSGTWGAIRDFVGVTVVLASEYVPPEPHVPAEQYWPPDGEYRFTVELGIAAEGSGTYVWGTDVWGTALWSGYDPDYLDVTEYVQEFVCKSGRDKFDERMRTGTARVIFDNTDGWFNPDNGEDLDATVNLRPGRWLRLSAVRVTDDATWTIWEGFIHSLTETYGNGGSNSTTIVDAYDFAALMAQHNEPAQSAAGSGELTGDRINRVLDEFSPVDGGWPWRDVAAGAHTMQSTTLAQNLLEEAQRASDADNGAFWFRGKIATFRGFNWLSTEPRSVSPTLYPGRGEVGDPEIMDVQTEWTAQVIKNDVQMSASGGSAQRSQDTTSIGMYGRRSWQRLDLENDTDADVSDIADQILAAYAYDYQRVKQITIVPDANVTVGEMLAMQLGDLIYVTVNLGLRDWKYTVEAHVTGIEFRVRPADWDMVLRLDQSARGNPEA